jgi:hypothetical protein
MRHGLCPVVAEDVGDLQAVTREAGVELAVRLVTGEGDVLLGGHRPVDAHRDDSPQRIDRHVIGPADVPGAEALDERAVAAEGRVEVTRRAEGAGGRQRESHGEARARCDCPDARPSWPHPPPSFLG